MSENAKPEPKRVSLELPDDLEATYANLAVITHSASEIIIDFARLLPNMAKARVYSRVVMTPMNAKLLKRALETNLRKFETKFGEIQTLDPEDLEGRTLGFSH